MKTWALATAAAIVLTAPAMAQSNLDGRVGRLESEMRAVQRKVFPGGAGATVEPQITPEATSSTPNGVPATSAVADLSQRVTSLEQQMATMTGQIEQTQYRLRQLEDQFTAYKKATDAKLTVSRDDAAAAGNTGASTPARTAPGPRPLPDYDDAAGSGTPAKTPAKSTSSDTGRAAKLAAVQKPDTGDAAEDAYTYGYRLYTAKLYSEAEAQFKQVVATYPKHRRASYAQNLLGRSYLEDGKPSLASIAFYDNYKKYPDGERAPDSLFYLGQALTKLNKPADACKVYGELTDVYGGKISAAMTADVARARTVNKCSAK